MGLTQSTPQAEQPKPLEVPANNNEIKETPVEPPVVESVPAVEAEPSAETRKEEKAQETENTSEGCERYDEKPGTKVEIAPVEVAPSDDVVKKTKRKNKNKNKGKQNE